jgi:hypothetical protein
MYFICSINEEIIKKINEAIYVRFLLFLFLSVLSINQEGNPIKGFCFYLFCLFIKRGIPLKGFAYICGMVDHQFLFILYTCVCKGKTNGITFNVI